MGFFYIIPLNLKSLVIRYIIIKSGTSRFKCICDNKNTSCFSPFSIGISITLLIVNIFIETPNLVNYIIAGYSFVAVATKHATIIEIDTIALSG